MIAKLPESDEECVEAPPGATRVRREAVVPDGSGGSRADQAAAELFAEFSRSRIAEWIRAG
ncbi:MAG TPA: hypothetical protein VND91_10190, partial [Candidatus Saccharimonadia bacterium]|nr:hypothetical protein [Candidatus Saccharimonadia bacterium]